MGIVGGVQIDKINKTTKYILASLLTMVLLFLPFHVLAQEQILVGQVVDVSDGDTVKLLDDAARQHTVRLMGIDAPEKAQAHGQRSKQSLANLVLQKRVNVLWRKRDKYGRIVGKLLTLEAKDVCLEQIANGMAWHYKHYADEQSASDRERYADAEKIAQAAKVGLWQDPSPVPPWTWRQTKDR